MKKENSPVMDFIDATVRCGKCGTFGIGKCDCWTKCKSPGCTWSYEKGGKCGNIKNHIKSRNKS